MLTRKSTSRRIRPNFVRRWRLSAVTTLFLFATALGAPPPAVPAAPAGTIAFPTFGIAVLPPEGWQRTDELASNEIGRWMKLAPDGKTPLGVMTIQYGPKHDLSLQKYFEKSIERKGAKAEDAGVELAGEPAIAYTFPGSAPGPAEGLVAENESGFYIISFLGPADASFSHEMAWVRDHFSWPSVESPGTHLELRRHPTSLLAGHVHLQLPQIARPDGSNGKHSDSAIYFIDQAGLPSDWMMIQLSVAPNKTGVELETMADAFGASLKGNPAVGLAEPLKWEQLTGCKLPCRVSQTVRAQVTVPGGQQATKHARYALFTPTPDHVLLCQFFVDDLAKDDLEKCESLTTRMLQSIEWVGGAGVGGPRP